MLLKIFTFLLMALTMVSSLYSQESTYSEEVEYVIRKVSYSIEGNTRKSVLENYLDIKSGKVFVGRESLDEFLDDRTQMIVNQRTLESGEIVPEFEESTQKTNRVYVDLKVRAKDSWNYLALPYGKYDSNEGLLFSLRGRNYNFFGGMETLEVNLDYLKPVEGGTEYSINGAFAVPFYLWDYDWKVNVDQDISYVVESPLEMTSKVGLSVDIPRDRFVWKASVDQAFYLNREGEEDPDGHYMRTSARLGSSIPTGVEVPEIGEISYSPAVITSYAHKPFGTISEDRRGYELGGEHEVSAGRINWMGNFRDGIEISAKQNLRYNFVRELWLSKSDIEFEGHKFFGWGGLSSRVQGFWYHNETGSTVEGIGGPMRGILNSRIDGNAGVFANIDFPVKMWLWFLDRWFEGHISPFFDYGLVKPEEGSFKLDEGWYSTGLEAFGFSKAARSIYLRMSFGVDIEALFEGANLGDIAPRDEAKSIYTVFIGLGHHY